MKFILSRVRQFIFDGFNFAFLLLSIRFWLVPTDPNIANNLGTLFLLGSGFFLAGGVLSLFTSRFGFVSLGQKLFDKTLSSQNSSAKLWGYQLICSLIALLIISIQTTGVSMAELTDESGFNGAVRLFSGLIHPNLKVLPQAIINIVETFFIAFLATALALPVAFLFSFLAARNVMEGRQTFLIYVGLRTFLNITRSIEPLIWAIIFSVWVGIGPFAGMLALLVHSIASLAKQCSEIVESVSHEPVEGIESTGASKVQVVWFAIVPQVILPYVSFAIYRWDVNVRMATIIGLVGGGGIGTLLIKYQGQAMWPEVGCIILVIAIVVWMMDSASSYIREAIK